MVLVIIDYPFLLWLYQIVAKLLCTSNFIFYFILFFWFDAIDKLHAMMKNYSMIFSLESEGGIFM